MIHRIDNGHRSGPASVTVGLRACQRAKRRRHGGITIHAPAEAKSGIFLRAGGEHLHRFRTEQLHIAIAPAVQHRLH